MKTTLRTGADWSPDALLDFWLGDLKSVAQATQSRWRHAMRRWRVGPFAGSVVDAPYVAAQRIWCEQLHREGPRSFFRHSAWNQPRGLLAQLILLDQFPRSVYRGTALAYSGEPLTSALAAQLCELDWDRRYFNEIERAWVYLAAAHTEDVALQEVALERCVQWSRDLTAAAAPNRRRINRFVAWACLRGAVEHAETMLLFDRFPHRNLALLRPHRGGEVRYLRSPQRPSWSFVQRPDPVYFALLGALYRIGRLEADDVVTRAAVERLLRSVGISDQALALGAFATAGEDEIPYVHFYRHLLLPELAAVHCHLVSSPVVERLVRDVERLVFQDGSQSWSSIQAGVDVASLASLVRDFGSVGAAQRPLKRLAEPLRVEVRRAGGEFYRMAEHLEGFCERVGLSHEDRFQAQLCVEEMVSHAFNGHQLAPDCAVVDLEVDLAVRDGSHSLVVRVSYAGAPSERLDLVVQPDSSRTEEETALSRLGLQLVESYADTVRRRRQDGRNVLVMTKQLDAA